MILPEHVWADQDPFTFTNYDPEQGWPLGTGPYSLASTSPNQIVWDRRDDWWGAETGWQDLPEPLRLVWQITGSEENKAQLMSNNQLDSLMGVTLGAFEAIQARNPQAEAWDQNLPYAWADPCPRQLTFNTQVEPWNDPNMRRAVSQIINRNQIIAVAYEGTSTPSETMFVSYGGMEPFISAIVEAGYGIDPDGDVEAGQALIEEAGWTLNGDTYEKDGQPLSVDILVNNSSPEYTRTVDIMVEQLRAAGIDAAARPLEGSTMDTSVQTGDFVANYNWDACASVNEPWASMNRYSTEFLKPLGERAAGNNYIRWDTEAAESYSEVVEQIGVLPLGDPQIEDLVVEAYQYLDAETPIIPLVQASKLVPFDTTYWTGWPTAENNYNHPATWWNSTHQIIHNLTKAGG